MKRNLCIFLVFLSLVITGKAQNYIIGKVVSAQDNTALEGIRVQWNGTNKGALTTKNGVFRLQESQQTDELIITALGFVTDTFHVHDYRTGDTLAIVLQPKVSQEVIVEAESEATTISTATILPTEKMTQKEFKRAACCSLAESFETNATVDVSYSDAVTGAKQIEMLGLQGSYVQVLTECLPTVRGLASSYGLEYIPGTWLESISLSKGVASVVNGYEAMTGQMEIELKKPHESERLHLNAYFNPIGRWEGNLVHSYSFTEDFGTTLLAHGTLLNNVIDNNGDGFLDLPNRSQINIFNRWRYANEFTMVQWGIKALAEERIAGENTFSPSQTIARWNPYGITVNTERYEAFFKSGHVLDDDEKYHLAFFGTYQTHSQRSLFGLRHYNGNEGTFTTRAVFTAKFDENISLVSGASYLVDNIEETFDINTVNRYESVPGIFAEATIKPEKKWTFLTGIRYDRHNIAGDIIVPRIMVKYDIDEQSTIRLSAGKGLRFANIFAENVAFLASSRTIIIPASLQPEQSWNIGIGTVVYFSVFDKMFTLDADIFRTEFINQVISDLDISPNAVHFTNSSGSFSNSAQIRLQGEISSALTLAVAYRFNDVQFTTNGILQQRALYSPHKSFLSISYTPSDWQFDATWTYRSGGRIPFVAAKHSLGSDESHDYATSFDGFSIVNLQAQYKFMGIELYVGVENLLDRMQHHPIIDPQNPYGENFDASLVWGPIMGRMYYSGIRWVIE